MSAHAHNQHNIIPVIDIASLLDSRADHADVASRIDAACRVDGFFYVVGHGVSSELIARLERLSREFFARDEAFKMCVAMRHAGRAWRGYFPTGVERTSARPDLKEGLYFGVELTDDHPMVLAGTPLHGRNLFPEIAGFRATVLEYIDALTTLGAALMSGVALALGLPATYFSAGCTNEPLVLFRIFHYPTPATEFADAGLWGVGEHTDYGLLTILHQDDVGGLQVRTREQWIDAPPVANSFVCNIGDMLELMTGGLYRSTPHRVRACTTTGRLSFPFFYDPGFHAELVPIRGIAHPVREAGESRWDGADLRRLRGTYGEYLLRKVSLAFPELGREVLE